MTSKRKITDKNGVQVFPITHTRDAINALTTVQEIEDYDFTTGYPEKLEF